jgi:DNA-binding response OmpR family regulator
VTSDSLSHRERKKKILVVDNEPDMTRMLKMEIEPVGFMVDTFNDPVLALEGFNQICMTL